MNLKTHPANNRYSYPRSTIQLNSHQIKLPKQNKETLLFNIQQRNTNNIKQNNLKNYREQYRLPLFIKPTYQSTSPMQPRTKTLQSQPKRPNNQVKIRSKSIATTDLKDNLYHNIIKKQLDTIDISQLNQSSMVDNFLDPRYLTCYQKQQIKRYHDVYYIGHKAYLRKYQLNFRDAKNNYKALIGDHIAYRFEILKIIGEGAFGKVLQVLDHKTLKKYAIKISKINQQLYHQFLLEAKILRIVKNSNSQNKNIVDIKGDFQFRGHICIVTQILTINLYQFLKSQNYKGIEINITRKIIIQVLQALLFLHSRKIIHCDIKPQNLCFKQKGKTGVKLIDFGSACFFKEQQFTYIQSRYYRAPQIVLVKPYDYRIDLWSLGCLAFQLAKGEPLFPSRNQDQQMMMLNETLGPPPQQFLQKCQRRKQFKFNPSSTNSHTIKNKLNMPTENNLIDFISRLVKWYPEERMGVKQALCHDFILEGLPNLVRNQHLKQMNGCNPYGLYS